MKKFILAITLVIAFFVMGAVRFSPFPYVDIVKVKGFEGIGLITADSIGRINADTSGTMRASYWVWTADTVMITDSTLVFIGVNISGINKLTTDSLVVSSNMGKMTVDSLAFNNEARIYNPHMDTVTILEANVRVSGDLVVSGSDLLFGNEGIISNATDSTIKLSESGEDLMIKFTNNAIALSTGTGVTKIDFGTLAVEVDALDVGDGDINNVGTIYCDAIGVDPGASTITIGSTGDNVCVNAATAITIGHNVETVAINSSAWDITATGVATGFGNITSNGIIDADKATFDSLVVGGGTCMHKIIYRANDTIPAGQTVDTILMAGITASSSVAMTCVEEFKVGATTGMTPSNWFITKKTDTLIINTPNDSMVVDIQVVQ